MGLGDQRIDRLLISAIHGGAVLRLTSSVPSCIPVHRHKHVAHLIRVPIQTQAPPDALHDVVRRTHGIRERHAVDLRDVLTDAHDAHVEDDPASTDRKTLDRRLLVPRGLVRRHHAEREVRQAVDSHVVTFARVVVDQRGGNEVRQSHRVRGSLDRGVVAHDVRHADAAGLGTGRHRVEDVGEEVVQADAVLVRGHPMLPRHLDDVSRDATELGVRRLEFLLLGVGSLFCLALFVVQIPLREVLHRLLHPRELALKIVDLPFLLGAFPVEPQAVAPQPCPLEAFA